MGGRGSAGHRWRGTVSSVRSARMRSFQGGQDIGCVLGGGGGQFARWPDCQTGDQANDKSVT